MDATHFRQRAARARELAQSGDDLRLSRMLLDVAADLDAEAEAIEAEIAEGPGGFSCTHRTEIPKLPLGISSVDGEAA